MRRRVCRILSRVNGLADSCETDRIKLLAYVEQKIQKLS
jgi:hypothetical protein